MARAIVSRRGIDSARRGHPWIYAGTTVHLSRAEGFARIADEKGEVVGWGVCDPESPIAIRVWALGQEAPRPPDVFAERLGRAIALRRGWFGDGATTAYRLLNGEGDRTPGFVIDRYGEVAVLRIDGEAARAVAPVLLRDLDRLLREAGVTTLLERVSRRGAPKEVIRRFGPARPRVEVREHGVPFVVDLLAGQKTGAFLDQRENRRRIGEIVRRRRGSGLGARVLNLFSYTGGFSLHAALAGASVTSVDVATSAHAAAQESFRLAGLDPSAHAFTSADVFAFLDRARKRGEDWDVVISDPPSFAPSERAKPKAIAAYRSLHRACVEVLAARGTFVAASCSSHVSAEELTTTLDDLTLGRSDLRLIELYGHPIDHPTLPSFPEGRYLKLAVLE